MPVKFIELYTEELLASHPDWWFVFGDNYELKGRGGQAKVCRDKKNAIGWPTKKAPNNLPSSFLTDEDYTEWFTRSMPITMILHDLLRSGAVVVFPTYGLGTGLAKLPDKAPKILSSINNFIGEAVQRYGMIK